MVGSAESPSTAPAGSHRTRQQSKRVVQLLGVQKLSGPVAVVARHARVMYRRVGLAALAACTWPSHPVHGLSTRSILVEGIPRCGAVGGYGGEHHRGRDLCRRNTRPCLPLLACALVVPAARLIVVVIRVLIVCIPSSVFPSSSVA